MLAWKLEHDFDDTDLVLINWSSFPREDRIKNGYWRSGGNVYSSKFYGDKFIREYWDEENDFVKNAGAIIMANELFNIDYQSRMPYDYKMTPYMNKNWHYIWLGKISHIKGFDAMNDDDRNWKDLTFDNHPSILTHTHHAIKIAQHLGFDDIDKLDKVKESYKELHNNIHNDLIKIGAKRISKDRNRTIVRQAIALNLKKLNRSKSFQQHTGKETWHTL